MILRKLYLFLALFFCVNLLKIQAQNPVLFQEGDLYGYRTSEGKVILKAQFPIATDFYDSGIAYVADSKGWKVIDSEGEILFTPFIFDNAPDRFSNGLARFIQNSKIGFYNDKGEIIIPAKWTFAESFEHKKARVCIGCQKIQDGEHYSYKNGKWFFIDQEGKQIP